MMYSFRYQRLVLSFYLWGYLEAHQYNGDASKKSIVPLFEFGEKSYYIGETKLTYFEAEDFCKRINMDFVAVDSLREFETLGSHLRKLTKEKSFWSSGSKLLDGKNWFWLTASKIIEFTKWIPGQPDTGKDNNKCLQFVFVNGTNFYFSNEKCEATAAFICEKDHRHRDTASVDSSYKGPYISLLHFNGKSYYIGNNYKASFLQANQFCEMIHMKSVSIYSVEENNRLQQYIQDNMAGDYFWSSGSKAIDSKTWVWLSTGKTIEYAHWQKDQPKNSSEQCVELMLINGELVWKNSDCKKELYFICEADEPHITFVSRSELIIDKKMDGLSNIQLNQEDAAEMCRHHGMELVNKQDNEKNDKIISLTSRLDKKTVYSNQMLPNTKYVAVGLKAKQRTAAHICKLFGMELVSIQNKTKNDEIMKSAHYYGINRSSDRIWTSAKKEFDFWKWSDGSHFTYTNWAVNEPNNYQKNELCMQLLIDGKWNARPCTEEYCFICEYSKRDSCCQCQQDMDINKKL